MKHAKTWRARVRKVYSSIEELQAYDSVYCIAARCGYPSAHALWAGNPVIGGSTSPAAFGVVR